MSDYLSHETCVSLFIIAIAVNKPSVVGTSGQVPQHPGLTMADHYIVTKHLRDLSNDSDLIGLGGALGLYYPDLRRMNPLLEELVAAWLRQDNVMSASGDPSWASLIKALQETNHPGIAKKIEEGMELEA